MPRRDEFVRSGNIDCLKKSKFRCAYYRLGKGSVETKTSHQGLRLSSDKPPYQECAFPQRTEASPNGLKYPKLRECKESLRGAGKRGGGEKGWLRRKGRIRMIAQDGKKSLGSMLTATTGGTPNRRLTAMSGSETGPGKLEGGWEGGKCLNGRAHRRKINVRVAGGPKDARQNGSR